VRDVSVIVCTNRIERWPWLLECLDSLQHQSLPPLEVIVVVDGNPDIAERLRERDGPEVTLATPAPSGLSVARNLGLAHASGTFVAFLDDDATATDSWLKSLRTVLEDETVAGAGSVSLPRWEGGRPGWMPAELLWTLGCSYRGMPVARSEVRNVYGGSACFRRDIFTRFGGFNPNLGRTATGLAGCEETELCLRVRHQSRGLRFIHEPGSQIYHRVPRERQKVAYVIKRCLGEGRSKAILLALVGGSGHPLGHEARYLTRVVPTGIAAGIRDLLRGDGWGLIRAPILTLAAGSTIAAYATTRVMITLGSLDLRREASLTGAGAESLAAQPDGSPGERRG
jgi:glycosyltransferase involved in cell wall biosynthesis